MKLWLKQICNVLWKLVRASVCDMHRQTLWSLSINTVFLFLSCVTFLTEGLYLGFWIFACKLILNQKRWTMTKQVGGDPNPEKIICFTFSTHLDSFSQVLKKHNYLQLCSSHFCSWLDLLLFYSNTLLAWMKAWQIQYFLSYKYSW